MNDTAKINIVISAIIIFCMGIAYWILLSQRTVPTVTTIIILGVIVIGAAIFIKMVAIK